MGALSIMGKQFTRKATTEALRTELYELYLRRTDRIDTWDLVDLSGHHVVGGYLFDKPHSALRPGPLGRLVGAAAGQRRDAVLRRASTAPVHEGGVPLVPEFAVGGGCWVCVFCLFGVA